MSFQAAGRTSEVGRVDWREVEWDYAYDLVIIQWWQSKTHKAKPVVWLPSNGAPEVDVYFLLGAAAMNDFFNQRVLGLPDAANAGEAAFVFKPMSKLSVAEKKRGSKEEDGDEDDSALCKHIASLLNDVGMHSTSATFKPYAVSLLSGEYSGTSLRRGALRTMRSQGVDRDKCADTTGHSTMVPGGHSGGTVPIKSALHSYDEIDPNDVVHGTMALCGWKPPIGILTHAPKVATLEALEGTVPMASLEHLARTLFRLDSTVTPSLLPGKRLAPLVSTMLAHCIMYFTQVLDTYGGQNFVVQRMSFILVSLKLATKDTVVTTLKDWSGKIRASFLTSNLPVVQGGFGQQDLGPVISSLAALNSRLDSTEAAARARAADLEKQVNALHAANRGLQQALDSVTRGLDTLSKRRSPLGGMKGGGGASSSLASAGMCVEGSGAAGGSSSAASSSSAAAAADDDDDDDDGFGGFSGAAAAAAKDEAADESSAPRFAKHGIRMIMSLHLKGTTIDVLWATTVQYKLDTSFKCNLSVSDFNRLSSCLVYMRAVATPEELASVASLAPGAESSSAAVKRLGLPAAVARDVAAKLFLRLTQLEVENGLKPVNSRLCTVNACLERITSLSGKNSAIVRELSRAPKEPIVLPAVPAAKDAAKSKAAKRARVVEAAKQAAKQEEKRAAVGSGGGGKKKARGGAAAAAPVELHCHHAGCGFVTALPSRLQTHLAIHIETEGEEGKEEEEEEEEEEAEEEEEGGEEEEEEGDGMAGAAGAAGAGTAARFFQQLGWTT